MKPVKRDIVVWFSCGAASAVAAFLTVDLFRDEYNVRIVNNPVAEEDEDNYRFLGDVERWIGVTIERAINPKFPTCSANCVWKDRAFMSGPLGAPCTIELKKEARRLWEEHNPYEFMVMGFTKDETKRYERFILTERSNVVPILIYAGLTKEGCFEILREEGIKPPRIYSMGYPNANCIGCVKATSPTYWNHVRVTYPSVFKERAVLSRKLGAKLVRVNGERIFLDKLHPMQRGAPLKSFVPECGIFCEENG